jgi:hypothetical protein
MKRQFLRSSLITLGVLIVMAMAAALIFASNPLVACGAPTGSGAPCDYWGMVGYLLPGFLLFVGVLWLIANILLMIGVVIGGVYKRLHRS